MTTLATTRLSHQGVTARHIETPIERIRVSVSLMPTDGHAALRGQLRDTGRPPIDTDA